MKIRKIENCRNEKGFINLNKLENYVEKGEIVEGSNAKMWFNVDGVRFLFKEYNDVLPSFGEVLYSRVAKRCGISCAEYDFAIYNGKVGTISYDFLKENNSYYNFLELVTQFCDTNFTIEEVMNNKGLLMLQNSKYNNLTSICGILEKIFNISEEEKEHIELGLVKMFCLDSLFLHADRRLWNYGVVVDETRDIMCLAPVHDNSHVLCLQKGKGYIESSIYSLINGEKLEDIIVLSSNDGDSSLEQLKNYYLNCSEVVREQIEQMVSCIGVDKEVEVLSQLCKIDDVSCLWVKAVLNYRLSTILNVIESVKIEEDIVAKGPNKSFNKRK